VILLNIIFKTLFGSHLYGTNTDHSDKDYKTVIAPVLKDIIIGKEKLFHSYHKSNKVDQTSKSGKDVIENEIITLQKFLKLATEGQTMGIDMLFAPQDFWVSDKVDDFWINEIVPNRTKFLSKNLSKFVEYCVKQAAKYGIKGGRINTVKTYVGYFKKQNPETKLIDLIEDLIELSKIDHSSLEISDEIHTSLLIICGKKFPLSVKVGYVLPPLLSFLNTYGKRAREASIDQNVDKKACSHAFRAAYQVKELIETRNLVFPLEKRKFLLDIKTGKIKYSEFAPILEELVDEVHILLDKSDLPDEPDIDIDELILKYYNL
jgi:hypothetical protein